ncbi:protein translocase subunit secF [Magnetococcus marinus MC-1]|uniref:Protein translocase subunit SecF n=1 Tax=Magnetococcus marinus (strain ATCC BAA-1437 / JCM 17883 / MC-1) TaxID=156889 RepID=SECF_MAGMM|nr:protein translocase subunit SecF [Magnetococcus marinus]A0LCK8.1 RecName: Full=Protein translocase subunit SecF [Magnetococcus marinus MC-1]ABK45701.1 protein translocase subunit secF [Magnetococcus marinus MC-1]
MQVFLKATHFDFIGRRKPAIYASLFLIGVSLVSLFTQGLNFGIDFAGGTLIQVRFEKPMDLAPVRQAIAPLDLGDTVVQSFGTPEEVLIRVEKQGADNAAQQAIVSGVLDALKPIAGEHGVEMRRVEYVGPQVGEELTEKGMLAMLYAMVAILIYISFRFELRFALGAVLALVHDVVLTMGFFSVLQKEFTLVVVAALLTVVGYSLNDTIVVYDRIREEMKRMKRQPLATIINEAVNRTLSRTLITSLTTVLVLIALFVLGGAVIHDFALTLLFGVGIGTYSSIFVASPLVLLMDPGSRRKVAAETAEETP